jgi:hypothetical protein
LLKFRIDIQQLFAGSNPGMPIIKT